MKPSRVECSLVSKLLLVVLRNFSHHCVDTQDRVSDVGARHLIAKTSAEPFAAKAGVDEVVGTVEDIVSPRNANCGRNDLALVFPDVEAVTAREDVETSVKVVVGYLAHAFVPLLYDACITWGHCTNFVSVLILLEYQRVLVCVDVYKKK